MSARITRAARSAGWNVHFMDSTDDYFAGIYQYEPYTCANVWKELQLCFKLDTESGDDDDDGTFAFWPQPPMSSSPATEIIFLSNNLDPDTEMPHPTEGSVLRIYLVKHYAIRCKGEHNRDTCLRVVDTPEPRMHARFLASDDPPPEDALVNSLPTRRKTLSTSRSPSKRSASGSPAKSMSGSPTKDNPEDGSADLIPRTIADDVAQRLRDAFRSNCTTYNQVCAVTGMGKPWVPTAVGLGLQACHIVPQKHYHLYPHGPGMTGFTDPWDSNVASLTTAWYATWNAKNSILLFAHIHPMFDARLFAIHPDTHLIRVFVPYDVLLPYHGKKARLNEAKPPDKRALAYHWDSCVYENMTAEAQLHPVRPASPILNRPDLLPRSGEGGDRGSSPGDPSKRPRRMAPDEGAANTVPVFGTGGGGPADDGEGFGMALTPDSTASAASFVRQRVKSEDKEWSTVRVKREWDEEDEGACLEGRGRTKRQKAVTSVLDSVETDL
ncbi:hypothetical protein CONLIGDRAFT_718715 [Coniochaeta ligniaria NRRL 30616]|uniref:HNH nuclease domain-containing protein n=1 Tax=Coniochaeta ligniaria NRRL 30616 TaxID=1408157 RepID=A0A1J7J5C1_9PEZI|nr:hypothetical protein CONLIGDRAFT_718715 [Coniochaeta ligniaria NRRL 30616]